MKSLILALAIAVPLLAQITSYPNSQIVTASVVTLPALCSVPQSVYLTVAANANAIGLYECNTANIWTFRGAPAMPTVSLVADASSIPSSQNIVMSDSRFRYGGGVIATAGTVYPNYLYYSNQGVSHDTMDFWADFDVANVQTMDFVVKGLGGTNYRIKIDGVWLDPNASYDNVPAIPNDGGFKYITLQFPVHASHAIRFEMRGGGYFGGVDIDANATLSYPTFKMGRRVIVLGDSFVEPAFSYVGFARLLSDMTGWEVWNSGNGGTGYVATNGGLSRGNYGSRITTDVCQQSPDVVIFYGSTNDASSSAATVQANATADYQAVQSCLPNARIFVIGPVSPNAPASAGLTAASGAVKAAAAAAGVPFFDPIGENWVTGSVSVPASGNAYLFTRPDDLTHPTQLGHVNLATRLLEDMKASAPDLFWETNGDSSSSMNGRGVVFTAQQGGRGVGSISTTAGSASITGVNTQFTKDFRVGDTISTYTWAVGTGTLFESKTIASIASDVALTTTTTFTDPITAAAYTTPQRKLIQMLGNGTVSFPSGPIAVQQSTPASSAAACNAGAIWADATYFYACTASGVIKRVALTAF